jgi:signal transduction histidine kinase
VSPLSAFAFYPVWALAFCVAFVALRLGRSAGLGLPLLCITQGIWVTGLVLFSTEATAPLAERVLPLGIVEAAGFVHAAVDLGPQRSERLVKGVWAASLVVAITGAIAPRLFYGPGARGAGPLFLPVAVAGTIATAAMLFQLLRFARSAQGPERRAFIELFFGAVLGSLGGGATIALHVLDLGPIGIAAPFMLGSTVLAASATLRRESGRGRALVRAGLGYALITAALSGVLLTGYAFLLPHLVPPEAESPIAILAAASFITFFAALPLEPLRQIVVDALGRKIVKSPIGVRDLYDAAERSEARADQAERLAELGAIVGAVAHEIRNPLGVLLAHAKILEREGADPESLETIRHEIARARRFLDDLLRYGRPRPLEPTETKVLEAVRRAASATRSTFSESAASVAVTGDESLVAEVDPAALEDIVTILVHNAMAAMSGRSGVVRVAVSRSDDGALALTVEDRGPGVPDEIAPRLFEPFVTGRGRDAEHPGTGLGLAIASRWVQRHGGTIRHERPEEGGARFIVVLPTTAAPLVAQPPETSA